MPFAYRPMTDADLPAAAGILNESYRAQGVPADFSAWGLRQVVLPQFGIDLADSIAAEAGGALAGVLLLAVDRAARESYVFAWNVRPAFQRERLGLGLERRYAEKHRELGLRTGWACLGEFRDVGRYRAVRFSAVRTFDCLELPAPGNEAAKRRNGETATEDRFTTEAQRTQRAQRDRQTEHRTSNAENESETRNPKSDVRCPNSATAQSTVEEIVITPAKVMELVSHIDGLQPERPHWTQQWPRLAGYADRLPWQLLVARIGGAVAGCAVWRRDLLQGHVSAVGFADPAVGGRLVDHLRRSAGVSLRFGYVPAGPLHDLLLARGATVSATYTEIRRDRF
jgi:hypothetical protein